MTNQAVDARGPPGPLVDDSHVNAGLAELSLREGFRLRGGRIPLGSRGRGRDQRDRSRQATQFEEFATVG